MSDVILKVENVSKLYRLGMVGTGTFGGDVQRFWKTKILGQEDPFLKVGQTNDRASKEKAEFVWALQDINFEVKRGEVIGIIGRNGAGKSTLLKLLSRITSPTTGYIKSAGRMASLLEVGTGFHPELTGRENIFLNGAILGMTKKEIQSKFDEIVDFSGCELYIDTPAKRYSSGMTVRLGFAVAAFLDPEILVVDEVLAVGDAEFQKKAIGKMKEVSQGGGRTVLFVSHNMDSIIKLCPTSILMEYGKIKLKDSTSSVISLYNRNENYKKHREKIAQIGIMNNLLKFEFAINKNQNSVVDISQGEEWSISIKFNNQIEGSLGILFNFELWTSEGIAVGCFGNEFQKGGIDLKLGNGQINFEMGVMSLKEGEYFLHTFVKLPKLRLNVYEEQHIQINIIKPIKINNYWNMYICGPQHGFVPITWKNIEVVNLI